MSLLERVFFFHQEVGAGNYPTSRNIAEQFEVSIPTARRDINYLRDRLLAPLEFDQKKNGFFYREEGFSLPFEESPRIVFLLAMLNKLAEEAGLGGLKEVQQLEQRLSTMITSDYSQIVDALQVEWIEVESIDHTIFETIIEAVVRKCYLNLSYRSIQGVATKRDVAPIRVLNYQGRWYLYGFCGLRQANRLFHMSRVSSVSVKSKFIEPEIQTNSSRPGGAFGIFQGRAKYTARILFTDTAAELVRNQYWHKDQDVKVNREGVILSLPVNDDREIIMKILQYGRMAQVLSPPELIKRVEEEINEMVKIYQTL